MRSRTAAFASTGLAVSAAVLLASGIFGAAPARADDATQQEINQLQDQIKQLQSQVDAMKQQAQLSGNTTAPLGSNKPAQAYSTPSNQLGIESWDGQNSIELTGRLQLDMGDYLTYDKQRGLTSPSSLDSGFNARRARLGITGKFGGVWSYTLIGDFGGSDDGTNALTSGAQTSVLQNGYITFNGLNQPSNPVPLAFTVGYIDVPITLDEANSSNDIMFMERSSSQIVATEFGMGDFRSALGVTSYKTDYWFGAFATGPTSGTPHNQTEAALAATAAPTITSPQGEPFAVGARLTYNPIQDASQSLHLGLNAIRMLKTGTTATTVGGNTPTPTEAFTLSDRPELRIDPTALLSTGAITGVDSGDVGGVEAAYAVDKFFVQGEEYKYYIDRFGSTAAAPRPDLNFAGGYLEASYSVGGKRNYIPQTGGYSGVIPDNPFSISQGGGWGAVEFALRYSETNLNDKQVFQGGVQGGDQVTEGLGVNYYPNANVRIMVDYLHTTLDKNNAGVPAGAVIDAVAARFQVAF